MRKLALILLVVAGVLAVALLQSNSDSNILRKVRVSHSVWGPTCSKVPVMSYKKQCDSQNGATCGILSQSCCRNGYCAWSFGGR